MKKENNRSNRFGFRMMMAFTLAAGALMAVPAVVGAQPFGRGGRGRGFHGGGPRGKGMGVGKIMRGDLKQLQKRLQLKPWQVQKIKQLRKSRGKMSGVRLQMARIHAQMKVEFLANKPNAWKLKKLHQQKLKLRNKMANHRFSIVLQVAQMLTPTQRLKLKHLGRGFGRRGFGRGFGRGMRGQGRFGKRRGMRGQGRFGKRGMM